MELNNSRKEFIKYEKGQLNVSIFGRTQKINKMEDERKILLDRLSQLEALKDLTNSYSRLSVLQQQLSDIEGSLKIIDTTQDEVTLKKNEHELLLEKIKEYLEAIDGEIKEFRELVLTIYSQLALDSHSVKIFDVAETLEREKIKISVMEGSIVDSTGINQVRTLIYDMAVLLNIINKNLNAPRFIIHDGIFEGLHQSHFLAFINFLDTTIENLAYKDKYQYILTLNEHNYFDEIPDFKKEKIMKNVVKELTPSSTLFGKEF